MNILALIISILINNILLSLVIYKILTVILRKYLTSEHKSLLLLFSLGVGPVIPSLILYYSFILLPSKPTIFYILIVFLCYTILYFLAKTTITVIIKDVKTSFYETYGKTVSYLLFTVCLIFCPVWIYITSITPILRHDVFE
jgi:hypothetical protein